MSALGKGNKSHRFVHSQIKPLKVLFEWAIHPYLLETILINSPRLLILCFIIFFLRLSVFKPYVFEPQAICFWTTGLHFEDRVVVSFHLHEPEKNFKDEKHAKKAQLCRWVWRNRCASSSSSYFVLVLNGNGVVFFIVVNVVVVLLTLRIVQNWLFSVQLK